MFLPNILFVSDGVAWVNLHETIPWLALHREGLLLEHVLHLEPLNFFLGALVLVKDVRRLILGTPHLRAARLQDPVGNRAESHTSEQETLEGTPQSIRCHEAKTDRDEGHREQMVHNFGSEVILIMMSQKLSDNVIRKERHSAHHAISGQSSPPKSVVIIIIIDIVLKKRL